MAFATQTEPCPNAIAPAPFPTWIGRTTRSACGFTSETVRSSWFTTQTCPAPTATPVGRWPTGIRSTERPLSVIRSSRSEAVSVTHTAPAPAAIPPGSPAALITRRTWLRFPSTTPTLLGAAVSARVAFPESAAARIAAVPPAASRPAKAITTPRPRSVRAVATGAALSTRRLERRVVLEDPPLQLLQLRARLDSQLVDEPSSGRAIGLEGLRLAAAAVEGDQPQPLQALPHRVLARQRLELGDHLLVLPEGEVRLDPVLQSREPQLVEPPDLVLRERLVGEICKRRPAPECERLMKPRRREGRLPVPSLLDERLEARGVECVDPQRVPRRLGEQRAVAEHAP